MNNSIFCKSFKWLFLLMCLVIFDIGVKHWVRTCFLTEEVVRIGPGINFCYVNNTGLAFGLFSNFTICNRGVLICTTIGIILMFCINLYRSIKLNSMYNSIFYSMIIGGGLGNLYDRILYGSVVDFIDLYVGIWHYPVFNIADAEIFIGILSLILKHMMFIEKYKK